jgi:hypothetical protein
MVPGSIPGGVTWDFFRGSFWQNHVPWGQFSLWKWVPGISPGVKAASVFGWWPTTLVVPKVKKIWSLNLPGTPRVTSACRGTPLPYFLPNGRSYKIPQEICKHTIPQSLNAVQSGVLEFLRTANMPAKCKQFVHKILNSLSAHVYSCYIHLQVHKNMPWGSENHQPRIQECFNSRSKQMRSRHRTPHFRSIQGNPYFRVHLRPG